MDYGISHDPARSAVLGANSAARAAINQIGCSGPTNCNTGWGPAATAHMPFSNQGAVTMQLRLKPPHAATTHFLKPLAGT